MSEPSPMTSTVDDRPIDASRISIKLAVMFGILVMTITWLGTAAAAWVGFQAALSEVRSDNRLMAKDIEFVQKGLEEATKHNKSQDISIRELERDIDRIRGANAAQGVKP